MTNTTTPPRVSEQAEERALEAALDAEYPLPNSPHASVSDRARDNRSAFERGWNAHLAITQSAAPEASITREMLLAELASWARKSAAPAATAASASADLTAVPKDQVEDAMMTLDADRVRRLQERGPERRAEALAVPVERRSGHDRRGEA